MSQQTTYLESKNHYQILDGLRGVAALMVVIFHTFESYNGGSRFAQIMNHGYLAVDFFFLLSGFVVAYAYDDRWSKMTQWDFYKRRLIRLQPMVIMGSIIGALLFYLQQCDMFAPISTTPILKMLGVMLIGFTLIPILPSMDIRGWAEMHPLNGPAWSLFFEYVANILYAIILHKLPNKILFIFAIITGFLLAQYLIAGPTGDVIGGWSIDTTQLRIGLLRLLYPFIAGMLLCRYGKLIHVKNAFWVCTALLLIVFWIPRVGGPETLWMNGVFESISIIVVFPLIIAIGAGGTLSGAATTKVSKFLGDLSYPIYITHYPLIYIHIALVTGKKIPAGYDWPIGIGLVITSMAIAYGCLKLYDEPTREWLKNKFLVKKPIA